MNKELLPTIKFCAFCGSQNIEVDDRVDGTDYVVCGDCGYEYNIGISDRTTARDEFEMMLRDDTDFNTQWSASNEEDLEKNFDEWYWEVYKNN